METTEGRATGEDMKVAIVSTPRTCSSFLETIFARKFNLKNYSEIFSYGNVSLEVGLDKLKIIKETDNYSVKITSTSFLTHKEIFTPKTFPWEVFDKIILAERDDLTQQIASWLLLNHAQINGHYQHEDMVVYLHEQLSNVESIPFRKHEFNNAIEVINYFNTEIKNSLIKVNNKVKIVKYELLQTHPNEYLSSLNNILETNFSVDDLIDTTSKTELDYTSYIDYYKLREKIYAAKKENNTTE